MIRRLLRLLFPATGRRVSTDTVQQRLAHLEDQVAFPPPAPILEDDEGEAIVVTQHPAYPKPYYQGGSENPSVGEARDPAGDWRPEYLPAPEADRWCPHCRFAACRTVCGRCGSGTWARQVPAVPAPVGRRPLPRGRL